MTDEHDAKDHLVNLVKDFDTGMLSTFADRGMVRARPMGLAEVTEDGRLHFMSSLDSGKGTVDVTIETLDRLLPYADVKLLKLDVEGYELKALMGGMALIDRCSPVLVLEINAPALLAAGNSQNELLD